ncbi:MAG: hypothetical protein J7578_18450 [Chitinophagaceae bacterium]|nr:hypothetical protein [Chitinophagaceae bacterium]
MFIKTTVLLACSMLFIWQLFSQEKKLELQELMDRPADTAGINALMNHGVELINVDNGKARTVFNKSLEKSLQINYDYGIGSSYARLGYIEGHEGRNQEGINYAQKALVSFKRINRVKGIVLCYINIGYSFDILGMGDSSLHYLLKGIELLEETKSEPGKLARLYENVGTVLANRKELTKAIFYSRKAVELAISNNDSDYIVTSHSALCNVLLQSKDYRGGLNAARTAQRYLPYQEDPNLIIKAYSHLASAYIKLLEPDSAIVAAKKSMRYSANSDPANFIAAGLELSDAYELKKDHKSQKVVLDTLQRRAEADTRLFHLFSLYERIARLHFAMGNYKEAYAYQSKYSAFKDSFFSKQNTREMAEIESRFQSAQKERALSEKQLQLAQKDLALEKSRRTVLYSMAGLSIMLLVATVFFVRGRSRKKRFALQLESLQKQQEIDMLQALMKGEEKERSRIAKDLHDGIAGMLAAAKMHLGSVVRHEQRLEQLDDYRQTMNLLDEATVEVRKTSHNLMPEVLLQYGLDEALRRYCSNISSSQLLIQYDSWGEIVRFSNGFELSVYRIVQELLNNILKHSQAGEAILQLNHRGHILSITVEDNGVGFDNTGKGIAGMGLKSLATRTQIMHGKMEVDTSPGEGVSVYLEFDTSGVAMMAANEIGEQG